VLRPDGVAPIWMVGVSASVNLPLHHMKSRSSLLASVNPGGPGKRAIKQLWCGGGGLVVKTGTLSSSACKVARRDNSDVISLSTCGGVSCEHMSQMQPTSASVLRACSSCDA